MKQKNPFRYLGLVITSLTVGCASGPIKAPWAESLVGQKGILVEEPRIYVYDSKKQSPPEMFKRCGETVITAVVSCGMMKCLQMSQGEKHFQGVFDRSLEDYANNPSRSITEVIVKELPFENVSVKTSSRTAKSHDLVCAGKVWIGMKKSEFLFVSGKPKTINRSVSGSSTREQLVYDKGNYVTHYYYFEDGTLTSWQD